MKANKKVLGAAAALTMSLAMAAGSTFAWFTTGNTATVGQIELGVTSGSEALLISAGKTGTADTLKLQTAYTSDLTTDQLLNGNGYFLIGGALYHIGDHSELFSKVELTSGTYESGKYYTTDGTTYTKETEVFDGGKTYYAFNGAYKVNYDTKALADPSPVTTYNPGSSGDETTNIAYGIKVELNAVTTGDGKSFKGKDKSSSKNDEDAGGCYITLQLNFRNSEAGAYKIYMLDQVGAVSSVSPQDVVWGKQITYTGTNAVAHTNYGKAVQQGQTLLSRAAYASRLSFEDVSGDHSVKLWAPYDMTYGLEQSESVPAGYEVNSNSYWKNNLAADYETVFRSISGEWPTDVNGTDDEDPSNDYSKNKPASDSMTKINFTDSSDTLKSGATPICALNSTTGEGSVTIRIWLEGDDGDCFNSILTDKFGVKMAFATFLAS